MKPRLFFCLFPLLNVGLLLVPRSGLAGGCPTCPEPTPSLLDEPLWPGAPTPVLRSWSESSVQSTPLPASSPSEGVAAVPTAPPSAILCEGDRLRYRDGGNLIEAEGNVRIGYKNILLAADRAWVYVDRKEAYAEGNVTLTQGDNVIKSDKIRYDFITDEGTLSSGAGFYDPWFGRSDILESEGSEQVIFYGGSASTCDEEEPHYHLEATKLTIYPDDKLVAQNVTLYIGKVPVFWLPWYRRSLKDDCRGSFFYPGYRNKWGFFFLSGYHWCLPGLATTFHLDYRYRRGWAYGFDGRFYPGNDGVGDWQTYYLQDKEYENDAGERSTEERYLLEFKYRQPLFYQVNSYLALSYASDSTIRQDFFRREYDADSQPKSYLYLSRRWQDVILSLEVHPRLNEFEMATERLPETKLQVQEFQIGESDFYYQGENSLSNLTRKNPGESASSYKSGRFDTFHKLSYSRKFFGWLNILPSTSLRYDYYTRGPGRVEGAAGGAAPRGDEPGDETPAPTPAPTPVPAEERDIWRRTFSTGMEISTDIYGLFPVQTEWLDIDRLRHVITPSVQYVFTDNPTVDYSDLYQFDSIDRIQRQNFFILKLRNQLQTKRGDKKTRYRLIDEGEGDKRYTEEEVPEEERDSKSSWTLADLIISTPLYTRPDRDNESRLIGDFTGKLKVTPYSWVGLNLDLQYNGYDNRFLGDTLDLWLAPEDDWWLTFSHNYRAGRDRNQVSAELYLRINPVWAFQVYGRFDTVEGRFEEESFTIFRDFHCWSSSLKFERRDEEDDYSFFLSFWIKEFSQTPLNLSN